MLVFIIRRLLFLPVVFFGVTLLIVLLMQLLAPYQRAAAFVQSEAQLRNIEAIIEQYGLEDPWYEQYGRWLGQVFRGNLGYSRVTSEPVWTTLQRRFPVTLELTLYAIVPVIALGVWLGSAAAIHRDRFIDQFTRVLSIVGWSLPTFVLGIWLLVIFYGVLGWLEPGRLSTTYQIQVARGGFSHVTGMLTVDALLNGRLDIFWDALKHLILPVITLAVVQAAQIMRVMRSSLLDALSQDYVRTARAKGLDQRVVNNKHARRNALIPVVTLAGFVLIGLISGLVITETIFNYPGLGQWAAAAATQLDYASIMGFAVFTAVVVVLGNLLVDIAYGVVDPRIRYD
ncbi:ABC transporter permease [Truepera radiovictrix]|uniref:Binding-protein-dependent transport systems inner membrane component n=1 Tax=Truepera radiovictrix (strain DSM 17093 / CIP 108686 / LMG 22925 / RQ-24) TaxID=649638 RepID=D7CVU8_TRURR|nr:ABC transporter permease [Truepera radiovictrix]ADI16009.1 binding-protein-dependent transport systems inner membrane component [Truepera radiovictrix DSM 17093]WMT58365.1 ABC transporter permease [Truepera radiovictrix]